MFLLTSVYMHLLTIFSFGVGLYESMRQADLKNWSLEPSQFADLASSLNQFFQQTGMLQGSSGSNLLSPSSGAVSPGKLRGVISVNFSPELNPRI